MKLFTQTFLFAFVLFGLMLTSCGDDKDECTLTCSGNQTLNSSSCTCECNLTCADGETLNTTNCECETNPVETVEHEGEISADATWTADKIHVLKNKVYVVNSTLTIEPGTIIKGAEGTGVNATALVIERGGKINANGTADKPIIFTTVLDNITVGEKNGTNLTKFDNEKWGGVIVLGSAPVSVKDGDTEGQIEGIPEDTGYGTYGGSDAADNSGVLNYVSIRHGGANIGDNNEINGLTLGGVGNGTTISNIEVVGNLDDGVEFFGGTVNASNILVAYQGDDAIDIDQNYSGTIDNVYIIHGGDDTDEAFEIDGPENSTYNTGKFTVLNATAIAEDVTKTSGADLKSKAQGTLRGVSWAGYKLGKAISVKANFQLDGSCDAKEDGYENVVDGDMVIINSELVSSEAGPTDFARVYVKAKDEADQPALDACLAATNYEAILDGIVYPGQGNTIVSSATKGANTSVFGWTWADANGLVK